MVTPSHLSLMHPCSDEDYDMADAEAEDSGVQDSDIEEVPATPRINR